jgi:hypothetical protein
MDAWEGCLDGCFGVACEIELGGEFECGWFHKVARLGWDRKSIMEESRKGGGGLKRSVSHRQS